MWPTPFGSRGCGCRRRGRKGCHHSSTSARRRGRRRSNRTTDQSPPLQGEGWVVMGFPTAQASAKRGASAMEGQGNTRIRKEQRQRKLRRNPTDTERELWQSLRGKQLDGAKFRRQHPFGDYILDCACINRKLVDELDGGQHAEETKYDARGTRRLAQQYYSAMRCWRT